MQNQSLERSRTSHNRNANSAYSVRSPTHSKHSTGLAGGQEFRVDVELPPLPKSRSAAGRFQAREAYDPNARSSDFLDFMEASRIPGTKRMSLGGDVQPKSSHLQNHPSSSGDKDLQLLGTDFDLDFDITLPPPTHRDEKRRFVDTDISSPPDIHPKDEGEARSGKWDDLERQALPTEQPHHDNHTQSSGHQERNARARAGTRTSSIVDIVSSLSSINPAAQHHTISLDFGMGNVSQTGSATKDPSEDNQAP